MFLGWLFVVISVKERVCQSIHGGACSEQTRVSGDAEHGTGSIVVDHAYEFLSVRCFAARRCDVLRLGHVGSNAVERTKTEGQFERCQQLRQLLVQTGLASVFQQIAKDDVTQIGIHRTSSDGFAIGLGSRLENGFSRKIRWALKEALFFSPQRRKTRRKTSGVRQKMDERRVGKNALIELHFVLVAKPHGQKRGRKGFGQGCKVKPRCFMRVADDNRAGYGTFSKGSPN